MLRYSFPLILIYHTGLYNSRSRTGRFIVPSGRVPTGHSNLYYRKKISLAIACNIDS